MCIAIPDYQLSDQLIAKCSETEWGLGNRDVVYTALQSQPRERQMYVMVLAPGVPHKFGTHDLRLLLGMSKYVSDWARYF